MALTNVVTEVTLDVYNHDTTQTTVKAIALDSKTRFVKASLRDNGEDYSVDADASVTLTVLRPDNVGVQITGSVVTVPTSDLSADMNGVQAELTQAALAVKGTLKAQFKITSGDQILRTEIFIVSNGTALDAETSTWVDTYNGFNLDEMTADIATLQTETGDLSNLTTTAKTNLVAAINEVDAHADSNASAISQLNADLTSIEDGITQPAVGVNIFDNDFDQSGYYDHGAEASGSNYTRTSKYYEIADGVTTLYSYHTVDASTCNYVFYDAEKVWLANRSFNSAQTSVVIPTGAKYFRVYKHISLTDPITIAYVSVDHYIPYGDGYELKDGSVSYDKLDAELQEMIDSGGSDLAETVAEHTTTLNQITRTTTSPNIFDGNFDESGLINSNGSEESNSSYVRTSSYYDISENNGSLYIILTATRSQFRLRFYDSSNAYVGTGACNNSLSTVLTVPTGATKFRVYTNADYTGNACISLTPQSTYIAYGSGKALAEDLVDYEALDDDLKEKVGGWLKGKTIAFMGDSIVGNFYDATGICALLAEKTGATVHNCAFGGTQMALRNSEIQNVQYWNALSGYSLSDAIASGDFTAQQTAVDNITGGIDYFQSRLAYIKTIDWDAVDIIMWEYGTNDFSNEHIPIKDTSDLTNVYSYYGAYCHTIETLLTAYPHLRIVPVTPMWRYWQDSQNDHAYLYGADEHEMGGQLLPDFAKCAIEVSNKYHLPVIDNYYGLDANRWTRGQYFDVTDSVHPNANGRARIAKRIAHILPSLL